MNEFFEFLCKDCMAKYKVDKEEAERIVYSSLLDCLKDLIQRQIAIGIKLEKYNKKRK